MSGGDRPKHTGSSRNRGHDRAWRGLMHRFSAVRSAELIVIDGGATTPGSRDQLHVSNGRYAGPREMQARADQKTAAPEGHA